MLKWTTYKLQIARNTIAEKWGPVACCSKASKEAGMVERKICFILDACNPRGKESRHLSKG